MENTEIFTNDFESNKLQGLEKDFRVDDTFAFINHWKHIFKLVMKNSKTIIPKEIEIPLLQKEESEPEYQLYINQEVNSDIVTAFHKQWEKHLNLLGKYGNYELYSFNKNEIAIILNDKSYIMLFRENSSK